MLPSTSTTATRRPGQAPGATGADSMSRMPTADRPSALRDQLLQLPLIGDAVDQPGGLRLAPA